VSPPPPKKSRSFLARSKNESEESIVAKLEKFQPPEIEGVDGSVYSLRQLVSLSQIEKNSPIFDMRVPDILGPLRAAKKCLIAPSTLYRWISTYKNANTLAPEGNDGTRMRRPSYVVKSKLPILNERVLE